MSLLHLDSVYFLSVCHVSDSGMISVYELAVKGVFWCEQMMGFVAEQVCSIAMLFCV